MESGALLVSVMTAMTTEQPSNNQEQASFQYPITTVHDVRESSLVKNVVHAT